MSPIRHFHLRDHPYMTTTVTIEREPIFKNSKVADTLLETILFGKRRRWYYLLSFVIMPDHIHLIIIPSEKNISGCMKSIKGFSARQINKLLTTIGSIWQEGFYDYILDTEEKVVNKIKYIEENPVRKGIVTHAEDYRYSSIKYREQTDFNLFF